MKCFNMRVRFTKVQESRCSNCGTWCQGFIGPDGKLLCSDCYYKIWGKRPY